MAVLAAMLRLGPLALRRLRLRRRGRSLVRMQTGSVALDDLVELAPVEPDPAALRAIIDLDPRPFAHYQGRSVHRASHRSTGIGHLHHSSLISGSKVGSTAATTRDE